LNMYVDFPSFPFNPIASSIVFDATIVFLYVLWTHIYACNMVAFTGKNKDHYFQTDLATVQNVNICCDIPCWLH
jgi:hypothetical protein